MPSQNDNPTTKSLADALASKQQSTPPSSMTETPTLLQQKSVHHQTAKQPFYKNRIFIAVTSILALLLICAAAVGAYTYSVTQQLMSQAEKAQITGQTAYDAFKAQDLPGAQGHFEQLQTQVGEVSQTYQKLSFYKYLPILRNYYLDGEHGIAAGTAGLQAAHKTLAAITPYADLLGLSGEGTFEGGTAENRIKLMLETLDKVQPVLDEVAADLNTAEQELAQINENRYPEYIRGRQIRGNIIEVKNLVSGAQTALSQYRPIIDQLPEMAGAKGERKKYLILFQNDNELRPTGGFLTAYAVVFVENGVVTPEKSDDIYELDKKFTQRIPIPEKLGRFLTTERYFHLRDMNTSPDFKESMEQFYTNYQTLRGEPANIDGIIAVDTHVLTELLKVVGPVQLASGATFGPDNDPRCDCPQIIYALSEIITRPTPYLREDRKGILAPLMQAILQKVYASPRVYMADLFATAQRSIEGRHVQAYLFDDAAQTAAEAVNVAGRFPTPQPDTDFLAIINSNLGGAKSNLFIDYDVQQDISSPENGYLTKTVEITYKNNRKGDNCNLEAGLLCLNSTLRDWTRIYVPAGSELVESQGFINQPETYEENGYQVIDGYFTLEPLAQAKIRLTYRVPYNNQAKYMGKVWKQGGVSPFNLTSLINGYQEQHLISKDTNIQSEW